MRGGIGRIFLFYKIPYVKIIISVSSKIIGKRTLYIEEYRSHGHSVSSLHYHLILVTKYRREVFDDALSKRAREIFEYVAPAYWIELEEWNHDKDHIHVLFSAVPSTDLSKFINAYKSASSRLLKKEFPQIKEKLWKEYFWSRSFCLITTGGVSIEVIRKYIESQGEKSRANEKKE